MSESRPAPNPGRLIAAVLRGTAEHHAKCHGLTEGETVAAVAELQALAGGRAGDVKAQALAERVEQVRNRIVHCPETDAAHVLLADLRECRDRYVPVELVSLLLEMHPGDEPGVSVPISPATSACGCGGSPPSRPRPRPARRPASRTIAATGTRPPSCRARIR